MVYGSTPQQARVQIFFAYLKNHEEKPAFLLSQSSINDEVLELEAADSNMIHPIFLQILLLLF